MFIQAQDGELINGDTIARITIYHKSEGDKGYAVEARRIDRETSKTLFTGSQDACQRKLQTYQDTLNNTLLHKVIRQVYKELSGIQQALDKIRRTH